MKAFFGVEYDCYLSLSSLSKSFTQLKLCTKEAYNCCASQTSHNNSLLEFQIIERGKNFWLAFNSTASLVLV